MSSLRARRAARASFLPGWFPGGAAAAARVQVFPVVAATNISTSGSASSHNCALPASISAGDLLIIFVAIHRVLAATVSTPSLWTPLYNQAGSGDLRAAACFFKVADGSEGASVSVSASASASWACNSYRITGYQGSPEAGTPATGSSSLPNPPNLAPTWGTAKTLWLAAEADISGGGTPTPPTNYTNQITQPQPSPGTPILRMSSARRELEASSENPGTFTLGSGNPWVAGTVAIRPA